MERLKAYCVTCKKMVSDDLLETADGIENNHEHRIVLFRTVGLIDPGGVIEQTFDLTPKAYLEEASKLDAELITNMVMKKFNIPLPKMIVSRLIEEVLRVMREVSIDEIKKERKKEGAQLAKAQRPKKKVAPAKKRTDEKLT